MAMNFDLDWWIHFRNPKEIWAKHPSFLVAEIVFYIMTLLTLRHAFRHGGRYLYLWITTILHGLTVESLSYLLPDIDNFWHAQSSVMLLGKRLPLHIMFFYPSFIYTASIAVSKMKLSKWAEPFAVGLAVVIMDIPFDIMGIKMLWWTWHDTDPNIFDRHFWVPWTSYYFHATFACSFTILFQGTRRLLCDTEGYKADGFVKEWVCSLVTGVMSMPFGVLQFLPVYHVLHDNFGIHTEVCVFLLVGVYLMAFWTGDRHPSKEARTLPNKGWFDEIALALFIHFPLYIVLSLVGQPQNVRAVGLHETLGDCQSISPVNTASGQVLTKKTYLCGSDYDEGYFDFHCLKGGKPPKDGLDWYTICGTPFPHRLEYVVVVGAFSLLGMFVFTQMLKHSGRYAKGARPAASQTATPARSTPRPKRD